MKLFAGLFVMDLSQAKIWHKSSLVATCDLSNLFINDETVYKIKCGNILGSNYSDSKKILRLFKHRNSDSAESIKCAVSCKYDLEQKKKLFITAKTDKNGKCVVDIPKEIDNLCGKGCNNKSIKELMGSTVSRHSCSKHRFSDMVLPGESCAFSCQTTDGDYLEAEESLKCTCNTTSNGRKCDWTVGESLPLDSFDKNGIYRLPTVMGLRADGQQCNKEITCADDEYLAMTHPDFLYGNMLDYYQDDPEEYGFNIACKKRQCVPVPLDDLVCYDKNGNQVEAGRAAYEEGTRCGRVCNQPGYGHDHTPTDAFAPGKEQDNFFIGDHARYNFVPATDAVCTCGHQYSWPKEIHDYYGQFEPDQYYGSYCEWTYGTGPMQDYKPVMHMQALTPQVEQNVGNGQQAATYLAECKPKYCNADMINDDSVRDYIVNELSSLYSDYGSNHENGFQHVRYTVDGEEFEYGFAELWNFREISCPDSGKIEGDQSMVSVGTKCKLSCKQGYTWLNNDDRSDEVECIGMFGTFGFGAWNWMPKPDDWHPGYGSPILELRVCVPNNYLDRDHQSGHQSL